MTPKKVTMEDVIHPVELTYQRSIPQMVLDWTEELVTCLLYTSPSPRDLSTSRMPSSA